MSSGAALARKIPPQATEANLPLDPTRMIIEKLRAQGSACISVTGHSMWPSVRPRDLVFVKRIDMARVSPGQIVAFAREGRLIVHRVLSNYRERHAGGQSPFLITKGDSLDGPDLPVCPPEFLGHVIRIHRGRRHIDLNLPGRRAIGRIIASVSRASKLIYAPLRFFYAALKIR